MGITAPTIVNTGINATKVNLWVKTLVIGKGNQVVGRTINGKILDPVVETVTERVTQRERLQTDVGTLLNPTVGGQ